jgi:hypothetical protein
MWPVQLRRLKFAFVPSGMRIEGDGGGAREEGVAVAKRLGEVAHHLVLEDVVHVGGRLVEDGDVRDVVGAVSGVSRVFECPVFGVNLFT